MYTRLTVLHPYPQMAGALIQALAGYAGGAGVATVLAGRAVAGLGNGALCSQGPVYLTELAPPAWRGVAVTLFQFFITIGIWICVTLNTFALTSGSGTQSEWDPDYTSPAWGWRLSISLQAICCAGLFVLTFILPESPRYLIKIGETERATSE